MHARTVTCVNVTQQAGYQVLVRELGQAIEGKTDTDDQLAAAEQELGEARGRIDAAMPLARQVAQDLAALVAEVCVLLAAMQHEAAAEAARGGVDSASTQDIVRKLEVEKVLMAEEMLGLRAQVVKADGEREVRIVCHGGPVSVFACVRVCVCVCMCVRLRMYKQERVACAMEALESVKSRWRQEEKVWREEAAALKRRVSDLQAQLDSRPQSQSADDDSLCVLSRASKSHKTKQLAAEKAVLENGTMDRIQRAASEARAQERELGRRAREAGEAELARLAAAQAADVAMLQEEIVHMVEATESPLRQQVRALQMRVEEKEAEVDRLNHRLESAERESEASAARQQQLQDKYSQALQGLQTLQDTLGAQLDTIDLHLQREFSARFSLLYSELAHLKGEDPEADVMQPSVAGAEEEHAGHGAGDSARKLLSRSRCCRPSGPGTAAVEAPARPKTFVADVSVGGTGKILAKSLRSCPRRRDKNETWSETDVEEGPVLTPRSPSGSATALRDGSCGPARDQLKQIGARPAGEDTPTSAAKGPAALYPAHTPWGAIPWSAAKTALESFASMHAFSPLP